MLEIISALQKMSQTLKDEFNRLDGTQGDGDLGVTVELVTKAIHQAASEASDVQSWMKQSSVLVRKQAPSTMGVLLSFALSAAAKSLVDKDAKSPNTWVDAQFAMIEEIKRRGGANLGDRTVLDAFIPASEAFRQAVDAGSTVQEALQRATESARNGAEATKNLVPKTGRASWVGERAIGEVDGGAWLCYKAYDSILQIVQYNPTEEKPK